MTNDIIEIASSLFRALEAGRNGEELRLLFSPDATVTEHPNAITPNGATRDLEQTLAGSIAGASLLAEQRYDVHETLVSGDTVVFRLTWRGTVGRDVGGFTTGQVLTAHIASFVTVAHGVILSIDTYDCYEPFAR